MFHIPPAHPADVTVGAGPDAPPVLTRPIGQVVSRMVLRRRRPVADLVPAVARGAQHPLGHLIHIGLEVIVGFGHLASPDLPREFGAVFDDQGVGGDMIRMLSERALEGTLPLAQRLAGSSVDEIEAHVEPGLPRPLHHPRDAIGIVRALERRKYLRHRGLHTERDAGEARVRESAEIVGVDGIRVRLGRHLSAIRQTPSFTNRAEHPHQVCGGQQRRSAATEEHRRHGAVRESRARHHRQSKLDLGNRLARVIGACRPAQLFGGEGVVVAVPAAHPAERNVNIDTELARRRSVHHGQGQRAIGRGRVAGRKSADHLSPPPR